MDGKNPKKKNNKKDDGEDTDPDEVDDGEDEECEGEEVDQAGLDRVFQFPFVTSHRNPDEERRWIVDIYKRTYTSNDPEIQKTSMDDPEVDSVVIPEGIPIYDKRAVQRVYLSVSRLQAKLYIVMKQSEVLKERDMTLRRLKHETIYKHNAISELHSRFQQEVLERKCECHHLEDKLIEIVKTNAVLKEKLQLLIRKNQRKAKQKMRENTDDILFDEDKPGYFQPSTHLHTSGGVIGGRERRRHSHGGLGRNSPSVIFQRKLEMKFSKEKFMRVRLMCDEAKEEIGMMRQELYFARKTISRWRSHSTRELKRALVKVRMMINCGIYDIQTHYTDELQVKLQMEVYRDFGLIFDEPEQQQQHNINNNNNKKKNKSKWGSLLGSMWSKKKKKKNTLPSHHNNNPAFRRPLDGRPFVLHLIHERHAREENDLLIFPKREGYVDLRLLRSGGRDRQDSKKLMKMMPSGEYRRYYIISSYKFGTITVFDSKEDMDHPDMEVVRCEKIRHVFVLQNVEMKSDPNSTKVRIDFPDFGGRAVILRFFDQSEKQLFVDFWKNLFAIYRGDYVESTREEDEEEIEERQRRKERMRKVNVKLYQYKEEQMRNFEEYYKGMKKIEEEFGDYDTSSSSSDDDSDDDNKMTQRRIMRRRKKKKKKKKKNNRYKNFDLEKEMEKKKLELEAEISRIKEEEERKERMLRRKPRRRKNKKKRKKKKSKKKKKVPQQQQQQPKPKPKLKIEEEEDDDDGYLNRKISYDKIDDLLREMERTHLGDPHQHPSQKKYEEEEEEEEEIQMYWNKRRK